MVDDGTQETHIERQSDEAQSELEIAMKNYLKGMLYPVRIIDRAPGRLMAVLRFVSILMLVGSLTAIHVNGAQARLTEEEYADGWDLAIWKVNSQPVDAWNEPGECNAV